MAVKVCTDCDAYVQTWRRALLPIVGRRLQTTGERPGDVLDRIRTGAHRRNHQVTT